MSSPTPRKPSKQQQDAIGIYSRLLDEARVRMVSLEHTILGATGLQPPLQVEFSYLQLRMLCEVTALCCLIAHGDIEAASSSKLQKEYSADGIIKKLETLHPNFYPHPVVTESSGNTLHIERVSGGFLTKSELLTLYHECGGRLHRGSLAKFRSAAPQAHHQDLEKVKSWRSKFLLLLKAHHVASFNNLSHFICFLSHAQADGKAMVVFAQSPLPEPSPGGSGA